MWIGFEKNQHFSYFFIFECFLPLTETKQKEEQKGMYKEKKVYKL